MDSSTPPVEDEVSSPLVFQCLKCNLIVGDSYSFHCANPEQHTISLSAASNIKRVSELFTSFSGSDIGSTYVNFTCSGCQVIIWIVVIITLLQTFYEVIYN